MESAYYVDTGLLSPDATGIQIMSIFGSSIVTSSNRSGRSSAAASAAAAKPSTTAAAAPPFPTFLLPALPLQLFRRRQKSHHQHQSSSSSSSSVVRNDNSSSNNPQNEGDCESDSDSDDGGAPSLSGSVHSVPSETSSSGGSDTTQQHQGRPRRQQPRRRLAPPTPATLRCGICATDLAFASQIVSKGFTGRHGRAFLVAPASPSNVPVPIPAAGRLSSSSWSSSAAAAAGGDGGGELVNIKVGRSENRQLVTGSHVVADISCRVCGTKVGWKYVDARESQQKYKVGKFILETARVVAWRGWDAGRLPAAPAGDDDGDGDYDDGSDEDDDEGLDYREDEGPWSANEGSTGNCGHKDRADGPDDEEPVVFDSDDDDECEDIFAGTWNAEAVAKRRKMRRALVGRRV
ncbi:hypothetical protein GGTG_02136 [Gaeumannomyces tritici R3-111a-1]|uniref:Yippee domain-containing protein n=1 Tax=Gaeumannomyces tritici (strain R3-111a-1) TaxID=644352 RepID=J3NLI7_GAET3|nr:hypothetical protein GGTG_02136 [Gaeumannomyces tritici R3-111a-1]EJT82162.1 hypothetical protein GGTG_02136 [Gaeumannomyces tritici R3-111a-1]